jgi:hypothetical protein
VLTAFKPPLRVERAAVRYPVSVLELPPAARSRKQFTPLPMAHRAVRASVAALSLPVTNRLQALPGHNCASSLRSAKSPLNGTRRAHIKCVFQRLAERRSTRSLGQQIEEPKQTISNAPLLYRLGPHRVQHWLPPLLPGARCISRTPCRKRGLSSSHANGRCRENSESLPTGGSWPIPLKNSKSHRRQNSL